MNKEEIMQASEEQLNELTAIKVMGWGTKIHELEFITHFIKDNGEEVERINWDPAYDLNVTAELEKHVLESENAHSYTVELVKMTGGFGNITYNDIKNIIKLTPVQICRAALLATL